ncbi:MAG: endonuclease V [Nitriliruptorales bacterium]
MGASYICFARGVTGRGRAGDYGWASAALKRHGHPATSVVVAGMAGAGYVAGLLALREGRLRWRAVLALEERPELVIVDATGRDHPRRAGLALHLGAVLDLPTVGVTERPLAASGKWPADRRGAIEPLVLDGELVGYYVRTRPGVRPVVVHAAWRTSPEVAVDVVLAAARRARTPQALRGARRAARIARSRADGKEES